MLTPTEAIMNKHPARWSVLILACLLVAACHDKRDPVKPSVNLAAAPASLVQAFA
jgi:hypothetical protein